MSNKQQEEQHSELNEVAKQAFVNCEQARAAIFNRLTALLCQPEQGIIENADIFDTLKLAFDIVQPGCISLVEQMHTSIKRYTAQDLLVEYTRLFIGPFETPAPPYSSLYFGSDMLMDDETIWVMNCYKKAGLEFDRKLNDVPDHVAVETEFMYYLIHSELKALDAGSRDDARVFWEHQQTFYTRHYKKWVPQFCEKILSATENDYYKKLSETLNSFVNHVGIPAFASE